MEYDIEGFLRRLEEEFAELEPGSLKPTTPLNNLIDWSSLNIMLFLAFIATEYNIKLTFDDIKFQKTLQELFDLIFSKTQ